MLGVNILSKENHEVELRVFEREDLKFLHGLTNNAEIMSFWFEEHHQSFTYMEELYRSSQEAKNSRQFILEKDGVNIGFVALFEIHPIHRKAEFAIMIDPNHQGHGYAGIATELAMDYAFTVLNLHKLYLIVDEANEKAVHVYEKAGFKHEAILREEYFVKGTYHHALIMSALQRDYLK